MWICVVFASRDATDPSVSIYIYIISLRDRNTAQRLFVVLVFLIVSIAGVPSFLIFVRRRSVMFNITVTLSSCPV